MFSIDGNNSHRVAQHFKPMHEIILAHSIAVFEWFAHTLQQNLSMIVNYAFQNASDNHFGAIMYAEMSCSVLSHDT